VTIVGSSREGVRAARNVSTPGLSPPTHSAASRAERDVKQVVLPLSYVLLLLVVESLWVQVLKNGNCNWVSSESTYSSRN
jgi:hypothetical protein